MLDRPSIAAAGTEVDAPEEARMSVAEHNLTSRITYTDLYRRWEQNNWSAMDLDFSRDKEGWDGLSEIQRKSALWIYSMFFFGEDSVTDNLSPYIDAAPLEEQKYFLASQQIDEARHAIFFHRFFSEVVGAGDDIAATLAFTEQHLGWGYRQVFNRLDKMADELRRDRSLPKFAQAITSTTWSSRRPWPSPASTSSRTSSSARGRCPDSAPAWSTSPATSSATSASASRSSASSSPSPTSAGPPSTSC